MPFRCVHAFKLLQTQRQCIFGLAVQINQRPQKVIPGSQKGEQADNDQRGPRQGNDNGDKNPPMACTIHISSLVQVAGNTQIELAQQEDIERASAEPGRCDQWNERIG
ncbi:hypothetical protein D3C73_1175250 [compost metagenome]